ncbi:MAG: MBL fold metallo-hydrolase [Desulfobacteraceae bacterium]|nr:MBL fold metallo-hydrolase [Desulfobacteraceae bacterium]
MTEKNNYPIVLTDNLWVLGNYYMNLYLVKGKKASALIEVGISGVVDTVISQLKSLNISPAYLIATHPHTDHITGLPGLHERFPDALTVAGEGTQEFLAHPKALDAMMYEDRHMTKMFGVKPGRSPITEFTFPANHIVVKDEHEIDLGGIIIRCIKAKGHSPGNIVVHSSDINALFLSDSLGFHFPGRCFLPLFFTGYSDFLANLDYMMSLKPEIIGPGHQGPLTGPDAERAFKQSRQAALDVFARINEQKENNEIADDLFNEYYKDEFRLYSEKNIKNCAGLLVKRCREELAQPDA